MSDFHEVRYKNPLRTLQVRHTFREDRFGDSDTLPDFGSTMKFYPYFSHSLSNFGGI